MSKRKYKRIYAVLLCIAVFIIFTREPQSVPERDAEGAELLSDPERYPEGAEPSNEHASGSAIDHSVQEVASESLKSSTTVRSSLARSGSASESLRLGSLRSGGREAHLLRPTVHVWRSDFFGSRIEHREIRCGTLRCVWSSDGESTADVRVYHWLTHRKPSLNMKSPSVAMMLESEPNYGLIANYKAAGFDFSASPDPRSDFVRVAYPANMTKVMEMRSVYAARIRGATFVAQNCNKKRASLVSQVANIFPVYSLSSCVPDGTIRAKMSGSKVNSIAKYTHHLAFENSVSNGYVTEKIWDALKAGVTPIYYGAADVKRFVGFEPIRVENVLSAGVVPMFMAEPRRDFVVPVETYKCDVCRLGQ